MYKVTEKDLIGDIKDFPIEVVQKMVDEQVNQGNPADVSVFQDDKRQGRSSGGFYWEETTEGHGFWDEVISLKNFDLFFDKYSRDRKKYWIKNLTKKQVIHAPTEEIANRLCKKFDMLGLKWNTKEPYPGNLEWDNYKEETCYSPSSGEYCDRGYYTREGYNILSIDQLLDFQENEYPKVMEVSDDGDNWRKRVVFMKKNGRFLAWGIAETIEEAECELGVFSWKFAREIQPAPTLELTLDDIAKKFNVSPEQIRIKE